MHISNMNTKNLLACGKKVWESKMSQEDIDFVTSYPSVFKRNAKGFWYNANLANNRDQSFRESMWTETTSYA